MTTYTYPLTDFPNEQVAVDRLTLEIQQAAITVALAGISVDPTNATIEFRAMLPASEQVVLDTIVAAHSGRALPEPVNTNGVPLVALAGRSNTVQQAPREGDERTRTTHNLCDPTTWWSTSTRVSNEVLSGSGTSWSSVNTNWICLDHGRVHNEEKVVAEVSHGYFPVITVDGVTQKRRPPHLSDWTGEGANYDYVVDYAAGTVEFRTAPASAPNASYSYATSSDWYLYAEPGKVLEIEAAEIQWSSDISLNADIIMESQVPVVSTPDPNDPAHWRVVDRSVYKTYYQLADKARGAYPSQRPVAGSPAWRGTGDTLIHHSPFFYTATKPLQSSVGARLRVYVGYAWYDENNVLQTRAKTAAEGGLGGRRATATFYAISNLEGS
jgi:hypothetical protein